MRVLLCVGLFVLLLPYLWLVSQSAYPAWPSSAPATATSAPYVLLNESRPLQPEELELGDVDRGALLDLHGFRWLQAADPAPPGCSPLVLILVHSAVGHAAQRKLIRRTWGSSASQDDVLVRFMVGMPSEDAEDAQRLLDAEGRVFRDLVQGPFIDSYRNLTYKHVMALKWAVTRCPDARYVLKVDDDVLVNTAVLLDFVRGSLSPFGARDLLVCSPKSGMVVKRSYRSKWRVSYAEYPHRFYPTYCFGWAVMYSADVALRLYREAQRSSYFWIDDVLVTGILAARLGLSHASWEALVLSEQDVGRVLDGDLRPGFMLASRDILGIDTDTELRLWKVIEATRITQSPSQLTRTKTRTSPTLSSPNSPSSLDPRAAHVL